MHDVFFVLSPLEQFEIIKIFTLNVFGYDISLTNSALIVFLIFCVIFLWHFFILLSSQVVPTKFGFILENIYLFVKNLILENIGAKFFRYFLYIYMLFLLLIFSNLVGMVPYSFTVTSHLIFTFGLSCATFLAINIFGVILNGANIFSLFLPSGAPLVVAPYLIIIELISYFARVFSLAIRLFANMMSGHTLLKILTGFCWTMLAFGGFWVLVQVLPLIIVFLVTGLELAIACLQAYVFTVLVSIYLNDVIHLH